MITYVIIALTCLVSISAFSNRDVFNKALFNPYIINQNREWYRFFSHALVHADWIHLFFNMYALYLLGLRVEKYYFPLLFESGRGMLNYLLLYLGGTVVSAFPSFEKHKHNSYYSAVGASGAVSAVIFSAILIDPLNTDIRLIFLPFPIPSFILGAAYLTYSWYMAKRGKDNIGHDAHFWGAVFGLVITGIMKPVLFVNFVHQITGFFS
jgi:membrane associated rhomboid family serine protease